MARCDHCGNECVLPFTCQHCGGKFCPDCRLPPSHDCTGISSWNAKPRPSVGLNYSRGGGITVTGGTAPGPLRRPQKTGGDEPPYLKIMIVILAMIMLGLAWLALGGH